MSSELFSQVLQKEFDWTEKQCKDGLSTSVIQHQLEDYWTTGQPQETHEAYYEYLLQQVLFRETLKTIVNEAKSLKLIR